MKVMFDCGECRRVHHDPGEVGVAFRRGQRSKFFDANASLGPHALLNTSDAINTMFSSRSHGQ